MRLTSIFTALLVAASLYLIIFERDTLRAIAGNHTEEDSEVVQLEEAPIVSVVVHRSVAKMVEGGILVRGRTEAARRVDVQAETAGLVESEPLRKGAFVDEGELLCQLAPGTKAAELKMAEAKLLEAEANDRASSRLAERGFTAETAAIGRRAQLESAQASVEQAAMEIERLKIVAPFDGLLESDTAELGTLLQRGSHCATLIDLDPIKLVGFVPERDIAKLKLGSVARASLSDGRDVRGIVSFLSRSADETTRTYRIEVNVPNIDFTIRDGMTASIVIALDGESAHLLPQSALALDDTGRLGVRIADEGRARFRPINVVRDTTEGIWVTGLGEEADVIVVGQEYVTDGRKVAVTYRGDLRQ